MLFDRITDMTHQLIKSHYEIRTGIAVDATMGNGYDTKFLAELVPSEVYAFDIQAEALEETRLRLGDLYDKERIHLILDGHENMNKYLNQCDLIVFNLGYLPKGDHTIITKAASTLKGVSIGLNLMCQGGLMSILAYYGHDGGYEELSALKCFLRELDHKAFDVVQVGKMNRNNCPPILYLVKKR